MIYNGIYQWSVFVTALISFALWGLLRTVEYNDNGIVILILRIFGVDKNDDLKLIIVSVVETFFSFGFFVMIVKILTYSADKWKWLKKLFLRSLYIEGVWVGFYVGRNEIVLVIQLMRQTSDAILITGQSFYYNDGKPIFRGLWESISMSLNPVNLSLNGVYCADKDEGISKGFLNEQFVINGKKPPDTFCGYMAHYTITEKVFIMCKKYCDLEPMRDLSSYVNEAKRVFEDNKRYFDGYKKSTKSQKR
jgi:hypothetical protein